MKMQKEREDDSEAVPAWHNCCFLWIYGACDMLHFFKMLRDIVLGFISDLYSEYLVYKDLKRMHRSYERASGILEDNLKFIIAVIAVLILIYLAYKYL